jgi:hypothetical protein
MIKLIAKVKFRAFGITFATFNRVIEFDPNVDAVLLNERGVYLKIEA